MQKSGSIRDYDWWLLATALAICGVGVLEIWSATHASHLAGAMLNAYFSRTEHVLVLSIPFTSYDPSNRGLLRFISQTWDEKLRDLFNIDAEPAKGLYERMKRVRETLRNPLSHGGFESKGGSLWFRLPGVGMLPARMSRHASGFHFIFTPIGDTGFQAICDLCDAFDKFLKAELSHGWQWANAGLDVHYDAEIRAEYAAGMKSAADFRKLMDRTAHEWERHANFEY